MWNYAQNPELAPLLEAADERFELRTGRSRATALEQEPGGGDWVDGWLGVVHELGHEFQRRMETPLAEVMQGIPTDGRHTGYCSDEAWFAIIKYIYDLEQQIRGALGAWQFTTTRTLLVELWRSMGQFYEFWPTEGRTDLANDWFDLRPLLP